MIGHALAQKLQAENYTHLILPTSAQLDLLDKDQVHLFFQETKPEYVFLSTGKHGGIKANIQTPADFMYDNLQKQINVIHAAYEFKVKKLLYLASCCIYPKNCPQPMKEEALMTGPFEITNESYAMAKLAGIKLCQAYNQQYKTHFIPVIPANIYGPKDCFDLDNAHVCAALIRKFHVAKKNKTDAIVTIWGSGAPTREFLFVDDLAEACLFLMHHYEKPELINIGAETSISIKELAHLIAQIVGFKGKVKFDPTYPDGMPSKTLDHTKLNTLGWKSKINFQKGIELTYQWYLGYLENS